MDEKEVKEVKEIPQKKSEEEILMPEMEFKGFKIKPWTLGKLKQINPHLEKIIEKLDKKGIKLTLDNVQDNVASLYFAAVDSVVAILALSLNTAEKNLEELTISDTISLIYLIYRQNEESVKNVSSLLQMTGTQNL
jgi:hypothetical protein